VLIATSTRDDRVHPGHARKMTAALEAAGHRVHYNENIEGGHAGAADNAQSAFRAALIYEFRCSGPLGAGNADPWRTITDSLQWRYGPAHTGMCTGGSA
jgi:prolyl oligopeptidase